jgi:S-adenosylmethionine synthetase
MRTYLFTSESVSEGHPDKLCDQVSDAVLDAVLEQDPQGRVACECFVTTGLIVVGGELNTTAHLDLPPLVRSVIRDIGYTSPAYRFDSESCCVLNVLNRQSPDIALGVDRGGAGDQGLMFGYACRETPELMPLPIMLAHALVRRLAQLRKTQPSPMPYLRPDAKSQVTVEYAESGEPLCVAAVVVSTQHDPDVDQEQLRRDVIEHVIRAVIPAELLDERTRMYINPTGRFEIGGPHGDTGQPTWRATLPRTSSRRDWLGSAPCSSPMPSALPSPSRFTSTPIVVGPSHRRSWSTSSARTLT